MKDYEVREAAGLLERRNKLRGALTNKFTSWHIACGDNILRVDVPRLKEFIQKEIDILEEDLYDLGVEIEQ